LFFLPANRFLYGPKEPDPCVQLKYFRYHGTKKTGDFSAAWQFSINSLPLIRHIP